IPPDTPHLAVNRGDVTSIAVVARPCRETTAQQVSGHRSTGQQIGGEHVSGERVSGQEEPDGSVAVDLPRHLASLLCYPVGYGG
ncbi:MAG TPA: hypothetical protein VG123_21870, partial [Streptosporangiaceae bacterium]|nr:hypothetical protein [Streptosporangiaceae bacterium]